MNKLIKKLTKKIFGHFGYHIYSIENQNNSYYEVFKKFEDYTMIPSHSFIENLKLCKKYSFIKGDIAECGTWKGGMIAGIAEIMGNIDRTYYLFDSFEGLPLAKKVDGRAAILWQNDTKSPTYLDNCSADISHAEQAMNIANAKDVKIIKGWFNQTLPLFKSNRGISILRLDGDWYDSILDCMNYLYPQVVKNGLIIIDDYYVWDGTSRAIHDYLTKINSSSKIYTLCNGIAYILKDEHNE